MANRTDVELLTHALDLAICQGEALMESADVELDEPEDKWMWNFAKRTLAAAKAGKLAAIHAEMDAADAAEAAG